MEFPQLVGRAAEALIVLVAPVFVGLALLMPSTSRRAVGVVAFVIAAGTAALVNVLLAHAASTLTAGPRSSSVSA